MGHRTFRNSLAGASLILMLLVGAGCKRSQTTTPQTEVPVEQVPATIEAAFKEAPPEVLEQATEAVVSLQSQDDAAAFVQLESLSGRADLTPEQRRAAFESWMAINRRLQQSAAGGNSAAQETLDRYRASK